MSAFKSLRTLTMDNIFGKLIIWFQFLVVDDPICPLVNLVSGDKM